MKTATLEEHIEKYGKTRGELRVLLLRLLETYDGSGAPVRRGGPLTLDEAEMAINQLYTGGN